MTWDDFYNVAVPGQRGKWKIEKQPFDKSVFLLDTTRNFSWMSNKETEIDAHNSIKMSPGGKVLMAGLGIGYEAYFLKERPEITSIVIVEKEIDIIRLTAKYLKHKKIEIINNRILCFLQDTQDKFDFIYFDIFPETPAESFFPKETRILHDAAQKALLPGGKIGFWNKYAEIEL